jgi:hypothetical protein
MKMLSKNEKKQLKLEKLRQQSEQARHDFEQKTQRQEIQEKSSKSKKFKIYTTLAIVFSVLVLSVGSFAFINSTKPGDYDNFAKCLNEKGAIMYGASFCQYSHAQQGMFGRSFKFVNYQDFSKNPNVKITPTWEINGRLIERVQSFDKLSELTGCSVQ